MSVHLVTWEQAQRWFREMRYPEERLEEIAAKVAEYGGRCDTLQLNPASYVMYAEYVARLDKRMRRRIRMARKKRRGWV